MINFKHILSFHSSWFCCIKRWVCWFT